jgi:hypothetical protein
MVAAGVASVGGVLGLWRDYPLVVVCIAVPITAIGYWRTFLGIDSTQLTIGNLVRRHTIPWIQVRTIDTTDWWWSPAAVVGNFVVVRVTTSTGERTVATATIGSGVSRKIVAALHHYAPDSGAIAWGEEVFSVSGDPSSRSPHGSM